MKEETRIVSAALGMLMATAAILGLAVSVAFAQAQAPMGAGAPSSAVPASPSSVPPGAGRAAASGDSHALAFLGVIIALVVIIALLARWSSLRSRRETEAVQLEAQIADALLRERALINLGVLPKVHVPFWRGSPATVEMSGHVPSPELREEVLRVAEREAIRLRPDARVYDRLAVTASREAQAA